MFNAGLARIISFITAAMCFFFPDIIAVSVMNIPVLRDAPANIEQPDKIHFLKTGSSDAIILESDGHFAMVDAGEDANNPRNFDWLVFRGYENEILRYLKEHASDENGKVHLDFVLGTHSHSDHIGGFDTVILDPDVTVGRAYLKEYNEEKINDYEIEQWDNKEVYDQMVAALNERNVPIVRPDGEPFALGNFKVTLFNTNDPENPGKVGENDNSLGVLIEKNGTKIFLAGDMDNNTGDEERLAPEIGRVDLLKVGHHGYSGSSTDAFISTLMPKACVITNGRNGPDRSVVASIIKICRNRNVYLTGTENGVLAVVGDGGSITFYGDNCDY